MLHHLYLVRSALLGTCFYLPLFEGKIRPLVESRFIFPEEELMTFVKPKGTPEISNDGKNVRQIILECTIDVINWLIDHNPDDVKSIQEAVSIFKSMSL
ncbi:hypothetical protein CRE_21970 [Caenorhabditis remanei]|uniref:Uncharacterized protein n=1 Tax=Caenorhabditis remanei TaxID=31234 RepID=E3N3D1_CAERE|nr:hypothetical protein CRE_21970 [Caenorhabditis remanei]